MSTTSNTTQSDLKLRRHSIRTLTPSQLRVAQGGFNPQPDPPGRTQARG